MNSIPAYIGLVFTVATLYCLYALYRAARRSRVVLWLSFAWIITQGVISASGFYLDSESLPPRFIFLPLPPLLFIVALFISKKGRGFIDGLDQRWLTLLHIVRILVVLVLL